MGQHPSRLHHNVVLDDESSFHPRTHRRRPAKLDLAKSRHADQNLPPPPPAPLSPRSLNHAISVRSLRPATPKSKPSVRHTRSHSQILAPLSARHLAADIPPVPSQITETARVVPVPLRADHAATGNSLHSVPSYTVINHLSSASDGARTQSASDNALAPPLEAKDAEPAFLTAYPEYAATMPIDLLRSTEYTRLQPNSAYVDSMGGALYPEMLVRSHAAFLQNAVLGNTHSQSASSKLSMAHAAEARSSVLSHFNAPPGSKVIFTSNASHALKLLGESFPFGPKSAYVLPEDAHNSVHGIREFARRAGAEVVYMPGREGRGGIDVVKARRALIANAPRSGEAALAAFTGLSNLTNAKISLEPIPTAVVPLAAAVTPAGASRSRRATATKVGHFGASLPTPPASATSASFPRHPIPLAPAFGDPAPPPVSLPIHFPFAEPLSPPPSASAASFPSHPSATSANPSISMYPSLVTHAKSLGYTTLLDAAALAPSTQLDLTVTPVDAVAISFYKMFGYPTGIGALILGPGVGEWLLDGHERGLGGRPWFAGGTVDVVQVPGQVYTHVDNVEEAFEDGTLNYLQLPAIPLGLNLLRSYLPFIPTRVTALAHYLATQLSSLHHDDGSPAFLVLSRIPGWIDAVGGGRRRRLPSVGRSLGDDEDRDGEGTGGTVSFVVYDKDSEFVPLSTIASSAAASGIMLRTGCMCNPGGAAALLGLSPFMAELRTGATLSALEAAAGYELGVVRVSFGLASSFADALAVANWARASLASDWEGFRDDTAVNRSSPYQFGKAL
ncbi:unnamed protein product [Peniophora sp. CBMAI 1063]|nr:unnamed protein product [Peniophora sp. CBMAI 1063]